MPEPLANSVPCPADEAELEEILSRPTQGLLESVRRMDGDLLVLGAGGKMGPTVGRMARRALDEAGRRARVIAVARFSDAQAAASLETAGVETLRCDLLDRAAVAALPDAPNVIFMAGQKFGTEAAPELTWAMNVLVPAHVAERFAGSRIVVFSTGCVYPLVPVTSGGADEEHPLGPVGDYAASCVGRERIFSYYAAGPAPSHTGGTRHPATPLCFFRLSYAIDLRYGVLLDVALKVRDGEPVDVTMGHANVIWQGDACARAIQCLEHATSPPFVLNVTGPETVSIRALACRFGELLGREPVISGEEAPTSWLFDAGLSQRLFGYPTVSLDQMILWVAEWVRRGGRTLEKPTHFEAREGRF